MHNPKIPALLQTENPDGWHGLKGHFFSILQSIYFIFDNFTIHQGFLRASALTYTTVLRLFPFWQ